MPYFVYIIQSLSDSTYYKGSTEQPLTRLAQHNAGECEYTRNKRPWKLVYLEELADKRAMLIRERKLKRGNKDYYQRLIQSPLNVLQHFLLNNS